MANVEDLQSQWTHLYKEHLPAIAAAREPVQKKWPVFLDHCFARIILDNAVGVNQPWTSVIKSPAVRNMSAGQLKAAIELGQRIANGEADLVELDEMSLELRGKKSKIGTKRKANGTDLNVHTPKSAKKPKSTEAISSYFTPSPSSGEHNGDATTQETPKESLQIRSVSNDGPDMAFQLKRIHDSAITPFRKQMLTLLCQIPRGRYSTYQAMADHVTRSSHKSCARAVGSAMRNNPFAPEVPCHRILASDGTLGGFKGSWGEGGKYASHKHQLLEEEGVKFDSRGKVKGPPFRDFRG